MKKIHNLIVGKVNKMQLIKQTRSSIHLHHPIFLINQFIFEKTEQEHGRPRDIVSQTSNP